MHKALGECLLPSSGSLVEHSSDLFFLKAVGGKLAYKNRYLVVTMAFIYLFLKASLIFILEFCKHVREKNSTAILELDKKIPRGRQIQFDTYVRTHHLSFFSIIS